MEGSIPGFPRVTFGNYLGMKGMIDHLVEAHGFKKIGFMGFLENHDGFKDRLRGFKDGLK